MEDQLERASEKKRPDWGPPGKMATDGLRAANDEVMSRAGEAMLKDLSRAKRFVAKRAPGLPGLLLDGVEFMNAKDKGRKLAGIAGSAIGGAGGAALGAATGPAAPVAAPLGAAVGSVAGEHIAEELYDDHAEAVGRVLRGTADDIQDGIAKTKAWIRGRDAQVAGPHSRPPPKASPRPRGR